jgi:hypothetical protein
MTITQPNSKYDRGKTDTRNILELIYEVCRICEKTEDTLMIIRSRDSIKDKQYNVKKTEDTLMIIRSRDSR